MKSITLAIAAFLTLATGVAGAVIAYASTAPGATTTTRPVPARESAPPIAKPAPRLVVRYRPCPAGSVRQRKVCVRHVVHEITLAPQASPTLTAAGSTRSGSSRTRHHAGAGHTATSPPGTGPTAAGQHHPGADDAPRSTGGGTPAPGDD